MLLPYRILDLNKQEIFKLREEKMSLPHRLAYNRFGWYVDSIGEALWESNQRISVIFDELVAQLFNEQNTRTAILEAQNSVIEEMRAENDLLKKQLKQMNDTDTNFSTRLDEHDRRLDENNARFDSHDSRLDEHDRRLDENNVRFDSHDSRLDEHDRRLDENNVRFDSHDSRLDEHDRRLDENNVRFDSHDSRLDEHNSRLDENNIRFDSCDKRFDELFKRADTTDSDSEKSTIHDTPETDNQDITLIWNKDKHWLKALNVVKSLSAEHKWILVPNEFIGLRENLYPVEQTSQLELKTITGFAILKNQISCFNKRMLCENWFSQFHPVWIDDVFAVFSTLEEPCHFDYDKKKLLSFENEIKSLWNNSEVSELPLFFDTPENHLLSKMFPHKKYLMEQFRDMSDAPLILKQGIVKYCVSLVNIELSSFCNRSCAYCPVSFLDWRKDPDNKMDKEMFKEIIRSLAEIDYDGMIHFSVFNEPLYDREYVFWALKCVNKYLPKVRVKITSNGDYLTADYLEELFHTNLNELWISVHYNGKWNRDTQWERIQGILERIGIGTKGQLDESIDSKLVFIVDPSAYYSQNIRVFALRTEDFNVHGLDRGGVLTENVAQIENTDYCDQVFYQLNITYNGSIFPCCNCCSGAAELEKWKYGDIRDEGGIFTAYCSSTAAAFRRSLFAPRKSSDKLFEPCRNCAMATCDNVELYTKDRDLRSQAEAYLLKKENCSGT